MPTVTFTAPFLSQTTEPDRNSWTDQTGHIRAFLTTPSWATTRTATMRGVYTFPFMVTINSVSTVFTGRLEEIGSPGPSVSMFFNGASYGPPYTVTGVGVLIGPETYLNVSYVLTENIITVDATVRAQRLSTDGLGILYIDDPVITVDYSERPTFCNLGINF